MSNTQAKVPPFEAIALAKEDVLNNWMLESLPPALGIVLGSGLGALAHSLTEVRKISYDKIRGMPQVSVANHQGELLWGKLEGVSVLCLSGRAHLYEGRSPQQVVFGVRLLAALGVRTMIMTNAAGGISQENAPGSLMVINDHLNLTGQNPLTGKNDELWGPRFLDMSHAYNPRLVRLAIEIGAQENISLSQGVYAGLLGPTYETPAEVRMLEILGADAVGMSTVHEVIALRHQGVDVVGISCITNKAAGISETELNHEEVAAVADRSSASFLRLVTSLCREISSF